MPCGTTGESPTLTHDEHHRVTELCIEVARAAKCRLLPDAARTAPTEAISLTKHAEKAGADAALHVTPYYNQPTQEGLYQHYQGDP